MYPHRKIKLLCKGIILFCAVVILMHMISIIQLNEVLRGVIIIMAAIAAIVNYKISKMDKEVQK
jgi:hypothetical protein